MRTTSLIPWVKLTRLPAVFTALADIFAGYLLTRTDWTPVGTFAALVGASGALYLSGMVFNDVFDLEQDRVERPQRPIPSGAISRSAAVKLAIVLVIAGLVLAACASRFSLIIAGFLVAAILGYDSFLKRTPLGPVAMGTCRFLNILLGASSSAITFSDLWGFPQLWVAVAMGIYITGVTWFARTEARTSRRSSLICGLILVNVGLMLLAAWILKLPFQWGLDLGPVGTEDSLPMLLFWGVIAISVNRRGLGAVLSPVPGRVQPAIGAMLLSVISINAMIIYFRLGPAGLPFSIATLALVVPAVWLKRWISMT